MKNLKLCLILWNQQRTGLFDFRTDPYDQKFHFRSYTIDLPTPTPGQTVFYFIHTSLSDSYKFQIRKRLQSCMDQNDAEHYKLMGGFKISLRKEGHQRIKAYIKVIPASEIPMREYLQNRKEKITHCLPYWIVRTLNNTWKLRQQQILKLGRLHLKVEEIKVREEEEQSDISPQEVLDLDEKKQESRVHSQLPTAGERRCRVCFGDDDQADPDNFLINPCHCKGSIRQIHVSCLKEWLNSKLTKLSLQLNGQIRVSDRLCCQICKMRLPSRIRKHGKLIPLMRYIEEAKFIKLRPINIEMAHLQYSQFYLLFDGEGKVNIGRSDTTGLLLNDQSVSREHSTISIQGKSCFITDKQSKYGTLVFDQNLQVKLGKKTRAFQIQNGVYCFTYS